MTDLEYRVHELEKCLHKVSKMLVELLKYADTQMIRDGVKIDGISILSTAAMLQGQTSIAAKRSE